MAERRRRATAVLPLALALLALTGCTGVTAVPSAGGYAPYAPPAGEEPVSLRDTFDSTVQETHDYWSDPGMFAGADGLEYTTPDNGISVGASDPATGAYFPPTTPTPAAETSNGFGDVPQAVPYDRAGLGASTYGRLYMDFDGSQFVCSATVVNSNSRDVVVTAAHCLVALDGSGKPATSVVFVPGDADNGQSQPYGVWAAVDYLVPQDFVDNARADESGRVSGDGWASDFGFLVMEEKNGQSIQDVTGGEGIAFGVPVQSLTQIGYPSAPPFDGSNEFMCASTQWTQSWSGGYSHLCNMTQGSSGGAWNAYYDTVLGAGYVVAVNSTGDDVSANGCVLGQRALELYRQASQ